MGVMVPRAWMRPSTIFEIRRFSGAAGDDSGIWAVDVRDI
jgi:hypothetical protein